MTRPTRGDGATRPSDRPVVLATVAIAAISIIGCTFPGTSGKDQGGAPVPVQTVAGSRPAVPTFPPADSADFDMDAIGWHRVDAAFDAAGNPLGTRLRVGLLNGEVTGNVDIPARLRTPEGFDCCFINVAGPRGGRVAYTVERAEVEEIRVVSTADGEDSLVLEESGFVGAVELSADGEAVYFVRADRESGATSVWSAPVDGSASPVEVMPAMASERPAVELVARSQRYLRLYLSVEGGRLAFMDCAERCTVRVADLATHQVTVLPAMEFAPEIAGLTDSELIATPVCFEGSCERQALDVDSGVSSPLPPSSHILRSTVVATLDGPLLLWETGNPAVMGDFEVSAYDFETGAVTVVYSSGGDLAQLHPMHDFSAGVELPAGWFLVWPAPPGAGGFARETPRAVRIADGAEVELTALGG